ncbi:hypothetical protein VPH35_010804 [Triticum aestivum]
MQNSARPSCSSPGVPRCGAVHRLGSILSRFSALRGARMQFAGLQRPLRVVLRRAVAMRAVLRGQRPCSLSPVCFALDPSTRNALLQVSSHPCGRAVRLCFAVCASVWLACTWAGSAMPFRFACPAPLCCTTLFPTLSTT